MNAPAVGAVGAVGVELPPQLVNMSNVKARAKHVQIDLVTGRSLRTRTNETLVLNLGSCSELMCVQKRADRIRGLILRRLAER